MGIREYTKIATKIAFFLAILAVSSCFFVQYIFYGMICSIIGTLLSIIVIFIRTHYAVPTKWNHPSYIALALCSSPVIYVLLLIFFHKA